jgi:hypothetical protein
MREELGLRFSYRPKLWSKSRFRRYQLLYACPCVRRRALAAIGRDDGESVLLVVHTSLVRALGL